RRTGIHAHPAGPDAVQRIHGGGVNGQDSAQFQDAA
ncbi:MAG: hypothetical protein C5S45_06060, partial [Candidatus Methanocomedens sp.]